MRRQDQDYVEYDDEEGSGESFDYKRFYYALKERAWVIALCILAAGFVTYGYLKRSPKIYAATTILEAQLESPKLLNFEDVAPSARGPDMLKTLERLLQGRSLMERVILTNNLAADPRFTGSEGDSTPPMEKLVKRLQGMVRVESQYGTRLLNLTVEHPDRELARLLADSIVDQFQVQEHDQRMAVAERATQLLKREEERFRQKVQESERALQAYRKQHGAVSLDGGQDIVVQKLRDVNQKLTDASAVRLTLESEFLQAGRLNGDVSRLLNVPFIAGDAVVVSALAEVSRTEVEIEAAKQRWLPKHPKWIALQSRRSNLQHALSNAVLNANETLLNAYATAKQTEEAFRKELQEQTAQAFRLGDHSVDYADLQREAKANSDLYETVLARMKETMISKDWEPNKLAVVQPAFSPSNPVKPESQRILMMGLLVGLGVGLALALSLELLDSTLKSPDQAEAALGLPILTAIPKIRSVQSGRRSIVMSEDGEGQGAEAFRTLRTTVSMLGAEGTRRTFLFTSSVPEEGKTFCALNFAYSLAHQGLRTLVIEADLRCPAVERALTCEVNPTPGLADYLMNQSTMENAVQATDHPNLFLIVAGTRVNNPSELLGQEGFAALLQEALLTYDRVVVDAAPIHPVSDTMLLAAKVQTVCLVVCADRAPRKAAERAVAMLRNVQAPLAGIVFNRLSQTRGEHYYDYSYYPEYSERNTAKS